MIQDCLSNILYWSILTGFEIWKVVARPFLKLLLPLLKWKVDGDFEKFGWNTKGKGKLGVTIHNETEFYLRASLEKNVGVFESHVDKICTINDPLALGISAMKTRRTYEVVHPLTWIASRFNLQTKSNFLQTSAHYDIGNTLYEAMLGKTMQYTSAYWRYASTLDEAQTHKMDHLAHKLKLQPGMRVLDIGCGFGTLAYHLAKNFGVQVVGICISNEQLKYGRELCKGLDVDLRFCNYRDINEKFDRVICVEVLEHVGQKNFPFFFSVVDRCLIDDGIFVLQTMGVNHPTVPGFDIWSHKNLWPNGYVGDMNEIVGGFYGRFIVEDWQNIGFHYAKTIAAWEENFEKAWPQNLSKIHDERFYRTWKIYLAFAQSYFATRSFQIWQIVFSKDGLKGGYDTVIR